MPDYREYAKRIPWASPGRETPASRLARSILPVGILPFEPIPPRPEGIPAIPGDHPDAEKFLMHIVGTAIQAGEGKLITCSHVVEGIAETGKLGYVLASVRRGNTVVYVPYRIAKALRFVDPRTMQVNPEVDLAALLVPASQTAAIPYAIPSIRWGDSRRVGVGDPVVIAGYPLGKDMFRLTRSNRGIIQPTFYSGIISAVLPATAPRESRLFQVSIPALGGISGGPLFEPTTGKLLGIVTSGIEVKVPGGDTEGIALPMSYALPSEIIAPFLDTISFETVDASGRRKRWR